jgi:2-dehydro-3-deoxyphosphogluconate aldolase/(4S)-4-hydroxy-2-oxoglutarate aldolase
MEAEDFLTLMAEERASAILRTSDGELARGAMNAAVEAGFRIIEFTLSIPNAFELIREFAERDDLVVGAGTVLTTEEAEQAVEAGAQYLVSPVVDPVVIEKAAELGVAAMPGCATPSEMLMAHRAGAQLQKLFPAVATGPAWVQQTLGPMPFLKIVPTSGVTAENAADYLKAGAFAVGFVNSLFEPADVLSGNFEAIGDRARKALDAAGQGS